MKGLFITGTDTGVGKTIVTSALLKALVENGTNAIAMKPVQTGALNTRRAPDIDFALHSSKIKISNSIYSLISPYRFKLPASPHLAAKLEKKSINTKKIINSFELLKNKYETILVEGAGGIMVPITKQYFMLDLIKAMKLPVVLVARAGLGTINHTLLSYLTLKKAKIVVSCIVLNMAKGGIIEEDNLRMLQKLTNCKVVKIDFFKNNLALRNNLGRIGRNLLNQLCAPVAQLDRAADS